MHSHMIPYIKTCRNTSPGMTPRRNGAREKEAHRLAACTSYVHQGENGSSYAHFSQLSKVQDHMRTLDQWTTMCTKHSKLHALHVGCMRATMNGINVSRKQVGCKLVHNYDHSSSLFLPMGPLQIPHICGRTIKST